MMRISRLWFVSLSLVLLLATAGGRARVQHDHGPAAGEAAGVAAVSPAQHDHPPAAGEAAGRAAPAAAGDEARKVPLYANLGSHHRSVTTASAEAQRYFDQGLRLLYAFNHDEAQRAFRETASLDPDCAMAWWGVALSLGPNINLPIDPDRNRVACDAIQKALSLAEAHASEVERALIQALSRRYSLAPEKDRKDLDQAYARAMGEVSRRYPDDLDAATLYAEAMMDLRPWRLWTLDGKPEEGTEEILGVLESVLKRDPRHPGANHYYIHAVEASPHPERALASAERLRRLVPGAGHLIHMPAHIYMRTGDYDGARKSNKKAVEIDREYIRSTGAQGVYPLMYYNHNLHFLALSAAMEGRCAEARKAAAELAANTAPAVKDMPMAEFFVPMPLYVALRFQRWEEILKSPQPDAAMPTFPAVWRFARGVAHAASGKVQDAEAERAQFETLRAKVPTDFMYNLNAAKDVLAVASFVLDARIASAKGNRQAAIESWKKAVETQDGLAYDEPPVWYYPVRESLGGELLRAGRAAEAETVFRQDLDRNPRNGRSLFGLWESLKAQGHAIDAELVRPQFEAAWKHADVILRIADL